MATREKAPELLAYMAGIMDGEGSIVIERSSAIVKKLERRVNIRYQLKVGIVNTSKLLVDLFQTEFGGQVKLRKRELAHHKLTYTWGLNSNQAADFLRQVGPHMRVKYQQVVIALAFVGLTTTYSQGENNRWRVSEKSMRLREKCYEEVKRLNDFRGHSQRLIEAASSTDDVIV